MPHIYTEADIQYIRDNLETISDAEMAQVIGVTPIALEGKRIREGILRERHCQWTPEEEQFVRANNCTLSTSEMADALGRTPKSVEQKKSRMSIGQRDATIRPSEPKLSPGKPLPREMLDKMTKEQPAEEINHYEKHNSGVAIITPDGKRIAKYCPTYRTADYSA